MTLSPLVLHQPHIMPKRAASISPPPSKRPRSTLDDPSRSTPASRLRVFSWNINGIGPFLQKSIASFVTSSNQQTSAPAPSASLRHFLKRHGRPQILGLQEVKINPADLDTQARFRAAVNPTKRDAGDGDVGPEYLVHFCLPRDRYNATGFARKVYGVAVVIRRDFYDQHVDRVREVDWDLEGRVIIVETHSKLSIWTIYAVNGTFNHYRNPDTGKVVGTRHDRKLAFHKLMLDECLLLQERGYRLVLAGDFNVARSPMDGHPNLRIKPEQHVKNRADFEVKFLVRAHTSLQAIDSFRFLNPGTEKYTYHPRNRAWKSSCDRVDLILVSRTLGPFLLRADILESPAERGPSDHVPHFIELQL